jgi:hypothetical protein
MERYIVIFKLLDLFLSLTSNAVKFKRFQILMESVALMFMKCQCAGQYSIVQNYLDVWLQPCGPVFQELLICNEWF